MPPIYKFNLGVARREERKLHEIAYQSLGMAYIKEESINKMSRRKVGRARSRRSELDQLNLTNLQLSIALKTKKITSAQYLFLLGKQEIMTGAYCLIFLINCKDQNKIGDDEFNALVRLAVANKFLSESDLTLLRKSEEKPKATDISLADFLKKDDKTDFQINEWDAAVAEANAVVDLHAFVTQAIDQKVISDDYTYFVSKANKAYDVAKSGATEQDRTFADTAEATFNDFSGKHFISTSSQCGLIRWLPHTLDLPSASALNYSHIKSLLEKLGTNEGFIFDGEELFYINKKTRTPVIIPIKDHSQKELNETLDKALSENQSSLLLQHKQENLPRGKNRQLQANGLEFMAISQLGTVATEGIELQLRKEVLSPQALKVILSSTDYTLLTQAEGALNKDILNSLSGLNPFQLRAINENSADFNLDKKETDTKTYLLSIADLREFKWLDSEIGCKIFTQLLERKIDIKSEFKGKDIDYLQAAVALKNLGFSIDALSSMAPHFYLIPAINKLADDRFKDKHELLREILNLISETTNSENTSLRDNQLDLIADILFRGYYYTYTEQLMDDAHFDLGIGKDVENFKKIIKAILACDKLGQLGRKAVEEMAFLSYHQHEGTRQACGFLTIKKGGPQENNVFGNERSTAEKVYLYVKSMQELFFIDKTNSSITHVCSVNNPVYDVDGREVAPGTLNQLAAVGIDISSSTPQARHLSGNQLRRIKMATGHSYRDLVEDLLQGIKDVDGCPNADYIRVMYETGLTASEVSDLTPVQMKAFTEKYDEVIPATKSTNEPLSSKEKLAAIQKVVSKDLNMNDFETILGIMDRGKLNFTEASDKLKTLPLLDWQASALKSPALRLEIPLELIVLSKNEDSMNFICQLYDAFSEDRKEESPKTTIEFFLKLSRLIETETESDLFDYLDIRFSNASLDEDSAIAIYNKIARYLRKEEFNWEKFNTPSSTKESKEEDQQQPVPSFYSGGNNNILVFQPKAAAPKEKQPENELAPTIQQQKI